MAKPKVKVFEFQCPGEYTLQDDNCLECGEYAESVHLYDKCKKSKKAIGNTQHPLNKKN